MSEDMTLRELQCGCPHVSSHVLSRPLVSSSCPLTFLYGDVLLWIVLVVSRQYLRISPPCFSKSLPHIQTDQVPTTISTDHPDTKQPPLQHQHQFQWISSKHRITTWSPALSCRHTLLSSRHFLPHSIRQDCRPQRLNSSFHLRTRSRPPIYRRMLFLSSTCQPYWRDMMRRHKRLTSFPCRPTV